MDASKKTLLFHAVMLDDPDVGKHPRIEGVQLQFDNGFPTVSTTRCREY